MWTKRGEAALVVVVALVPPVEVDAPVLEAPVEEVAVVRVVVVAVADPQVMVVYKVLAPFCAQVPLLVLFETIGPVQFGVP